MLRCKSTCPKSRSRSEGYAAQALVDESVPEQYRLGTQNVVFRGDVSNCDQLTVLKLEACLGDLGQGMVDGRYNV